MKRKAIPPLYEAGECSSSGSRRPGHPHSTPWSCERAKTKLTTHVMQDSTLCPRQYLHAPLLCRGALCRVSHQRFVKLSHNKLVYSPLKNEEHTHTQHRMTRMTGPDCAVMYDFNKYIHTHKQYAHTLLYSCFRLFFTYKLKIL